MAVHGWQSRSERFVGFLPLRLERDSRGDSGREPQRDFERELESMEEVLESTKEVPRGG